MGARSFTTFHFAAMWNARFSFCLEKLSFSKLKLIHILTHQRLIFHQHYFWVLYSDRTLATYIFLTMQIMLFRFCGSPFIELKRIGKNFKSAIKKGFFFLQKWMETINRFQIDLVYAHRTLPVRLFVIKILIVSGHLHLDGFSVLLKMILYARICARVSFILVF